MPGRGGDERDQTAHPSHSFAPRTLRGREPGLRSGYMRLIKGRSRLRGRSCMELNTPRRVYARDKRTGRRQKRACFFTSPGTHALDRDGA